MDRQQQEHAIIQDQDFQAMVRSRNRFAWLLSASVLVIYFIFIAIASFKPEILAQTFGDQALTLGLPMAALVIIVSWLITGIYIYTTNRHFDQIKLRLKKEHHYE